MSTAYTDTCLQLAETLVGSRPHPSWTRASLYRLDVPEVRHAHQQWWISACVQVLAERRVEEADAAMRSCPFGSDAWRETWELYLDACSALDAAKRHREGAFAALRRANEDAEPPPVRLIPVRLAVPAGEVTR